MLAVIADQAAAGTLALAGFSFGSHVTTHVLQALWGKRTIGALVLVGTAASPSPAREREMTEPVSAKRVSPAVSSSSSPWPPRLKVPNGSQIQLT